ncbi:MULTISPECIES: hypothetical protein [unclassified Lactococcus]|uniref:hypothetical protein n=1 Tax=unclassified Lactococcus TaxID=2643510 RepID=UPI0011C81240|nr:MULTISPECIES: hypothetical protein [unclassified Lactococcus]MQW23263.1 hypothetical protein [Lactococcus sp. dk101]TXK38069.1 hypothetical protein FVP42_06565 [Lactococcus sp. dk310]TXK49748.1 hypothetical protein FVP43_06535 [Lactococcus sp. dk322]
MTETIEDLQARNQALEHQLLQQKVGHLAGLPDDIISRLKGDDERSMMQDAEMLINWFKPKAPVAPLKNVEQHHKKGNSYNNIINKITRGE